MKTWEMIRELTKYPYKEFISESKVAYVEFESTNVDYKKVTIRFKIPKNPPYHQQERLPLCDDWTEVKPKVGWEEALDHMCKGNKAKWGNTLYYVAMNERHELIVYRYFPCTPIEAVLTVPMYNSKEWELL